MFQFQGALDRVPSHGWRGALLSGRKNLVLREPKVPTPTAFRVELNWKCQAISETHTKYLEMPNTPLSLYSFLLKFYVLLLLNVH